METVVVVGLDLAKNEFQVHGLGGCGEVVFKRQLRRSEVLPFFAGCRVVWWGWKLVGQRIIGREN